MTVKATAVLSILAIWAAIIPAVVIHHSSWWAFIFAFLATGAVGVSFSRRLGLSRLLAIAGTWAGTAMAIGQSPDNTWVSVFAFLSTAVIVYSIMRRDALGAGLGIAVTWLVVGTVLLVDKNPDAAWISVFAFLTTGAVANNHGRHARGLAAMVWWCVAGAIMVATAGWYWLAVFAFVLASASLGLRGFSLRGFEWDFFERDRDDGQFVR